MNEKMLLCISSILAAASFIRASANTPSFYGHTDWYKPMGWCTYPGSILLIGDLNGDGRADMLCHDSKGNKWVALANKAGRFTGTTWHKAMGWCTGSGAQLHLGDFNGDGRTDMLCHDIRGNKFVSLANADGSFTGTSWQKAMGWCSHSGSRLMIGDFNGDGRSDMFCYDKRKKLISLAQPGGSFVGSSWQNADGWCTHDGSSIYIADFNGDLRDDLLCHDNNGYNWVMLSHAGGKLSRRSDWHISGEKWCSSAQLHLGFLNGDKRADMLCHRPSDGYMWVATAHANVRGLYSGTLWQKAMKWCTSGSTLFVADFNNDGKGDLLCHDRKTGKKWISYNRYPSKDECLKNPCQNGGKCVNNHGKYSCTCAAGFKGKNCDQDINECLKNPCQNCGKCINNKGGYSCTYAAGFEGKNCDQVKYEDVGCFKDYGGKHRPLPELIAIFRASIDWHSLKKSVDKCARRAKEKGYTYFGIQIYGECWSGPNAKKTYYKDGKSKYCWRGVGAGGSNFVRRVIN